MRKKKRKKHEKKTERHGKKTRKKNSTVRITYTSRLKSVYYTRYIQLLKYIPHTEPPSDIGPEAAELLPGRGPEVQQQLLPQPDACRERDAHGVRDREDDASELADSSAGQALPAGGRLLSRHRPPGVRNAAQAICYTGTWL